MNSRGKSVLTFFGLIFAIIAMAALSYFGLGNGDNTIFSYKNIKQGLDLKGGVYIVFEAKDAKDDDMKKAESTIRLRLDSKGYTEATVAIQGGNRLRVEIPDVEDADTAISEIGQTALLKFVDEAQNVVCSGSDIAKATAQQIPDMEGTTQVYKPGVSLEFSKEGASKFAAATAANIGKPIYIMLDENVISAPTVNQSITDGKAVISGSFTNKEASNLASLISSGALPVALEVVEMNKIGAQLGAEALKGGLLAGVVGTGLVLLFMLIMYRYAGFTADLALLFFITLEMLMLSLFKITLTLPGIAGIILTIGMAVDANVIIFERMKEELNLGKTVRTAIELGFKRAFPAILDGNVTTIIAAFVLYQLGTGPIKGFAQTLMIGVIISMFTAIFITRLFLLSSHGMGIKNRKIYGAKGDN